MVGHEGRYEVSSTGLVRNATTLRVLKGYPCGTMGYLGFRPGAGASNAYIHRAVALAFHGEPPTPKHQVAHNDGNHLNNAADNLRWATAAENAADRARHGTSLKGRRFLSAEKEREIRDALEWRHLLGLTIPTAAAYCGVSREAVLNVLRSPGARQPVGQPAAA